MKKLLNISKLPSENLGVNTPIFITEIATEYFERFGFVIQERASINNENKTCQITLLFIERSLF